jgi:hypothetical protein
MAFVLELLFLASTSLTKVSVLLFFRRLIDRTHNRFITHAIWAAIAFTTAYYFTFTFFLIFACNPVEASWKSLDLGWKKPFHCVDRLFVDTFVGSLSVFGDFYAMVIPVYIVSKLGMQMSRKIVLYGVFCCGLVVIGAGIARTYYLSRLSRDPRRDLTCEYFQSYRSLCCMRLTPSKGVGFNGVVWGQLELELGLICASAPAIRGFLSAVTQRVTTSYGTNSRKLGYGSRSRGTGGTGLSALSNGMVPSSVGTEKEEADKPGDEFLMAPERKATLKGGIMITETFSVERGDFGQEFRRPERL